MSTRRLNGLDRPARPSPRRLLKLSKKLPVCRRAAPWYELHPLPLQRHCRVEPGTRLLLRLRSRAARRRRPSIWARYRTPNHLNVGASATRPAAECDSRSSPGGADSASFGLTSTGRRGQLRRDVMTGLDQTWRAAAAPTVESRIRDRFAACVTAHFPTVQAGKIASMFANRAQLEALPVNELVSMTVRN